MDALVTDAHIRWSVAGIRALGRAGLSVAALAPRRAGAGLWSRCASARELGPDSISDPAGFTEAVARVTRRYGPLVVYPGHEEAVDALLAAELPREAVLPYPDGSLIQRLRDKRALGDMAAAAGLASPRTLAEGSVSELRSTSLATPCAVKAARPGGTLIRTRVAPTAAALDAILAELPDAQPVLIQELAEGPLTGLALVIARDGGVAACFQQTACRTFPPEAGGSALAVSVAPEKWLVERSARMLSATGFWGLAQLQFLPTARGPGLIDVNTRFYGSLPLALAAGVNLPAAWHTVAVGGRTPRPEPYRVGVTYRWLDAELAAAFRGSWRNLARRAPNPRVGAMWAAYDPLPSLMLALDSSLAKLRRRLSTVRG